MTWNIVTKDNGDIRVEPDGPGDPMSEERIANRPTKALLDRLDDGTWIALGGFAYVRDLDLWVITTLLADETMRMNSVSSAWVARVHRKDPLVLLKR